MIWWASQMGLTLPFRYWICLEPRSLLVDMLKASWFVEPFQEFSYYFGSYLVFPFFALSSCVRCSFYASKFRFLVVCIEFTDKEGHSNWWYHWPFSWCDDYLAHQLVRPVRVLSLEQWRVSIFALSHTLYFSLDHCALLHWAKWIRWVCNFETLTADGRESN